MTAPLSRPLASPSRLDRCAIHAIALLCMTLFSGCITQAAYESIEKDTRLEPLSWEARDVVAIAIVIGKDGHLAPVIRTRAPDGTLWEMRDQAGSRVLAEAPAMEGPLRSVTPCALFIEHTPDSYDVRLARPNGRLGPVGPIAADAHAAPLVLIDVGGARDCWLKSAPPVGGVSKVLADPWIRPAREERHRWTFGLFFFPVAPLTVALDVALGPFEFLGALLTIWALSSPGPP